MLVLRGINLTFRRHRQLAVLASTVIVLGVAVLNTHAALPEHHDAGDAICVCALSIATLAVVGVGLGRSFFRPLVLPLRRAPVVRVMRGIAVELRIRGIARAGPAGPVVLRR